MVAEKPRYSPTTQPAKADERVDVAGFERDAAKAATKGHRLEPPRWSYRRWDAGFGDDIVSCCLNPGCTARVTWEDFYGIKHDHEVTTALNHVCPYEGGRST